MPMFREPNRKWKSRSSEGQREPPIDSKSLGVKTSRGSGGALLLSFLFISGALTS